MKWHDLYMHGQRLEYVSKQFHKKFKKAAKEDRVDDMIKYATALNKNEALVIDLAKTITGVEQLVRDVKKLTV